MTQGKKLKIIDEINNAFIELASENKSKAYQTYLNKINKELIANIDTLDASKVKSIVEGYAFDVKDSVLLFMVLGAITSIINNQRLTAKERDNLLPIIAVLGIYSITKPKKFAERIISINKGIGLNDNEKKVKELLDTYYKDNEKVIASSINQASSDIVKSSYKVAMNTTYEIRKDLRDMTRSKQFSIKKMEQSLNSKYLNNKVAIARNIDTELHTQAELVKLNQAIGNGFTMKTWKTKGDKRVRDTLWHNQVANKTVGINEDFRAAGQVASAPGDIRLLPRDRIRCRCYLVYS